MPGFLKNKKTVIFFRLLYLIVTVLVLLLLFFVIFKSEPPAENVKIKIEAPKPNQFGFISDSLEQFTGVIKRNETLSDILEKSGVPYSRIAELAEASKNIFDVRKIKAEKKYHIYSTKDSLSSVKYFVYEKDPINYVVFNMHDSVVITTGKKDVVTKTETKYAEINHSLYVALMEADASPQLAIKLSQIYAWQIDFYHLQKGDNFTVVYEKEFVDTQFAGIGRILGARFNSSGKDFFAIPFTQDSVYQYFDENGNSLRKAFLKAPLEFARISSRFSRRRLHPVLKRYRPHLGVDYAAPVGTPVRSTGDGVVTDAGYKSGNGRYIKIRHNSVYTTMYLHLSKFAKGIKRGTHVSQGQVIGYVGSTGLSTGPHLDYRFFVNGSAVDPLKVEVPPSHPVKDELRADYEKKKNEVMIMIKNAEKEFTDNKDKPV